MEGITMADADPNSNAGGERSLKARKNVLLGFLVKGGSVLVGMVLVPMTIGYLDETNYGIWVTISSLVQWISFLDIGLGNGLRNHLAVAIAEGDAEGAKSYISTTYFMLSAIMALALGAFLVGNFWLNWPAILNAPAGMGPELRLVTSIVFGLFCVQFVLNLVLTLYVADQLTGLANFVQFLGNLLGLGFIILLLRWTRGSLVHLSVALLSAPVLVLAVATILLFRGRYRAYVPSLSYVKISQCRSLLDLGAKFFIVQVASILLYQTSNIIIIQILGPKEVTSFSVAFRYFGVITMAAAIIFTPYWSAITEAYAKQDLVWIRTTISTLLKIFCLLVVAAMGLLLVAPFAFRLWVGKTVVINLPLSIAMTAYVVVNAWNSIFAVFLNGVGRIKVQLALGIVCALLNVPLGVFLGHHFGTPGVVAATVLVCCFGAVIYPIQYRRIIEGTAKGIWAH